MREAGLATQDVAPLAECLLRRDIDLEERNGRIVLAEYRRRSLVRGLETLAVTAPRREELRGRETVTRRGIQDSERAP